LDALRVDDSTRRIVTLREYGEGGERDSTNQEDHCRAQAPAAGEPRRTFRRDCLRLCDTIGGADGVHVAALMQDPTQRIAISGFADRNTANPATVVPAPITNPAMHPMQEIVSQKPSPAAAAAV
jgi:hypothetical protein